MTRDPEVYILPEGIGLTKIRTKQKLPGIHCTGILLMQLVAVILLNYTNSLQANTGVTCRMIYHVRTRRVAFGARASTSKDQSLPKQRNHPIGVDTHNAGFRLSLGDLDIPRISRAFRDDVTWDTRGPVEPPELRPASA